MAVSPDRSVASEQAGDDKSYAEDLSKAEVSKRINALRAKLKL